MIELIVFDWGDTVMRDMPEYGGPMVEWPHVEAMPGIAAALHALKPAYQLALATNAAVSGAERVRGALARVGLEQWFDVVLTASELGVCKPDPAFFDALLAESGCLPHHAVMVGDNFRTDIVGAKLASLWAVWYNPTHADPPADAVPQPDAVIHTLDDLPAAIHTLDSRAPGSA
jgi:HAD superfamily hydrolase (TIGR01509 family)